MAFIPNLYCKVSKPLGETDLYGQALPGTALPRVPCAIIYLDQRQEETAVRADTSASRGRFDEEIAKARLLFPATFKPDVEDRVELLNFVLKVKSVFPRHAVNGRLDHYQVDLDHEETLSG